MKFKYLIMVVLFITFSNCKNKYPLKLDYCDMLENDQSFVNYDKNSSTYKSDKEYRHLIFKDNFEAILLYTEKNGFPKISLNLSDSDSCKYHAITMTFIHIAQSDINSFLFGKNSTIIKTSVFNGTLPKDLLAKSILVMLNTIDLCNETKIELLKFIKELEIEHTLYQGEEILNKLLKKNTIQCN